LTVGQMGRGERETSAWLWDRSTLVVVTYPILNIAEFSACEAALEWFVRV